MASLPSLVRTTLTFNAMKLRSMSSITPLVRLSVDDEGIAMVSMENPPVNVLNLKMLQNINTTLDELEKNKCKGMILSSAYPTVFAAGIDIKGLYADANNTRELYKALQDVFIKLFCTNFITAAAINGHAPAGGCFLGLCCEYRVMVDGKFTIGLNEALLGIPLAPFFVDAMWHTISPREAEFAMTSGKLYSVDEALKVGLIDDKAKDKDEAIGKCKSFIRKFDKIPSFSRATTKRQIRGVLVEKLRENRHKDVDRFMQQLNKPETRKVVEDYIENLSKKKRST